MPLSNKLLMELKQGIDDFGLIEPWDKIMVWVSGWKDSLALLDLLVKYKRYFKVNFEIVAVYIVPKVPEIIVLSNPLEEIFASYWDEITYYIKELNIPKDSKLLDWIIEMKTCQWCTYTRRITFFKLSEKIWANKLTFGHHKDDIVDTIFLNIVKGKNMNAMPILNVMERWDLTIVRPMCYIREKDIISYCNINNITPLQAKCPLDWESFRTDIRDAIDELERKFPGFVDNFFEAYKKKIPLIDTKWMNRK